VSIIQKLFGSKGKYDDVLNRCDLLMARDEILDFHKIVNAEGEAEGGAYYFKKEYVAAWETFRGNPNIDNARTLLEVAPKLIEYFEGCSPSGSFYATNQYLKKHGLKK
jgi:hypothetical protein